MGFLRGCKSDVYSSALHSATVNGSIGVHEKKQIKGDFMNWVYMEYYKHIDGLYYVIRYLENGELSIPPFSFKTKDSAIAYIEAHDLQAIEKNK